MEPNITINGVVLSREQSRSVREACVCFMMMLNDRQFSDGLGLRSTLTHRLLITEVLDLMDK